MSNIIILKHNITTPGKVPTTTDLDQGEVAINGKDGILYMRKHVDGTDGNDEVIPVGSTSSAVGKLGYELGTGTATEDTSNAWSPFRTTPNTLTENHTIVSGTSSSIIAPTIEAGVVITVETDATLLIL